MNVPRISAIFLAATTAAFAQTQPAPHPDTQYAYQLSRLGQLEVLKSLQAQYAGKPEENLYKAQLLRADFDARTRDPAQAQRVADDYLAALAAYLKTSPGIDGAWALDHGQFILSRLGQPLVTRMEYLASTPRDREALAPVAALADQLLHAAATGLSGQMKQMESAKPFDEKAYGQLYASAAQARYYSAWAAYFRAMSLDPAAAERADLLARSIRSLQDWAVDDSDNGVNFQAYLLRAKAESEAGDVPRALADFAKAQNERAPQWVQYQARHQAVVANLRAGNLREAQSAVEALRKWVPKENTEASLAADMLAFRVSWAQAEAMQSGLQRQRDETIALDLLSTIVARDPRYRDLAAEQLAATIPENADFSTLRPIQLLALARAATQSPAPGTAAGQKQLRRAVDAATTVLNSDASRSDKAEAMLLLGSAYGGLGDFAAAAKFNVQFAQQARTDPRAAPAVELALQQIGELRKAAAARGEAISPEVQTLAAGALDLAINAFEQKQWIYARARLLEEAGKPDEAAALYEKIPAEDRNYFDARYRLVTIGTDRFARLAAAANAGSQPTGGSDADRKAAAAALFDACSKFVALLDAPPASAPREVVEAAQNGGYRYNIWIIEAAAALDPAVKNLELATDRLDRLQKSRDQLTAPQRLALLRYRLVAFQLAGQADNATRAIDEFLAASGNSPEALGAVRGMVLSTINEIDKVDDPAQARRLAANVVQLLNPIIAQAQAHSATAPASRGATAGDDAYEYRLVQADMMVRAGQFKQAQQAALSLQDQRDKAGSADIRPNLTEARAIFGEAQESANKQQYAKAQDYFTRILSRVQPGSNEYWECWLRVIQAMQAQDNSTADEIKRRLADLKGAFGTQFGGTKHQKDFAALASRYGL